MHTVMYKGKAAIVILFSMFFIVSLFVGNSFQKGFGQLTFDETKKEFDEINQQQIEKFLELGREGYIKDCQKLLPEEICEIDADRRENESKSFQQNQASNASDTDTHFYIDSKNQFRLDYPADWHQKGSSVVKGTREFSPLIISDPKFSLLDTSNFGDILFDSRTDEKNVKVIDKPGSILIGGEPAISFSYTEDEKTIIVAGLIHKGAAYVFRFETLKENFEKDMNTAMDLFGSIKFLN